MKRRTPRKRIPPYVAVPKGFLADHPVAKQPHTLRVLLELHARKQWKDPRRQLRNGEPQPVKGQLWMSRPMVEEWLQGVLSPKQVRSALDQLFKHRLLEYPFGKPRGKRYIGQLTDLMTVAESVAGLAIRDNDLEDSRAKGRAEGGPPKHPNLDRKSDPLSPQTPLSPAEENTPLNPPAGGEDLNEQGEARCVELLIRTGMPGLVGDTPEAIRRSSAGVLSRLAKQSSWDDVEAAIRGMRRGVPPWSTRSNETFDARTLERHFAKALAAGRMHQRRRAPTVSDMQHQEEAKRREREELKARADQDAATRAQLDEEPPRVQQEIARMAAAQLRTLPEAVRGTMKDPTILQVYRGWLARRPPSANESEDHADDQGGEEHAPDELRKRVSPAQRRHPSPATPASRVQQRQG